MFSPVIPHRILRDRRVVHSAELYARVEGERIVDLRTMSGPPAEHLGRRQGRWVSLGLRATAPTYVEASMQVRRQWDALMPTTQHLILLGARRKPADASW